LELTHLSRQEVGRGATLQLRANSTEATMRPTDPTSEHFIHAEKLRQLRQQLAKTTDQLQRKEIARQIEEIEEGSNNQFQP